ncbi:MAG: Gfo/Idh/MocA family oxidoreductase [Methylococcales bacterium]
MKPFRWGVFGTGFAARKFVLGLHAAKNTVVTAVASRTLSNAQSFAAHLGIDVATNNFQQVAESNDVDAIYIATPPSLHCNHALISLFAGKPTLVEKPFTTNANQARDIISAAKTNGVFCMEGMWTRFLPIVAWVKQMINSGAIGDVRMMSGNFAIADAVRLENNLFNPSLGGGALLHRGVYPLSLAVHLLGVPDQISAEMIIGDTGIDEEAAVLLRYNTGMLANFYASTRTNAINDCSILGAQGRIHLHAPIYRPFRATVTPVHARFKHDNSYSRLSNLKESGLIQGLYQRFGHHATALLNRKTKTVTLPYSGNGYHYQAEVVRKAVQTGQLESSVMPLSESILIMEMMDYIRNQREMKVSRHWQNTD